MFITLAACTNNAVSHHEIGTLEVPTCVLNIDYLTVESLSGIVSDG